MASPNFVANGNISPSRFVSLDSGTPKAFAVIQATANSKIVGVAQIGGREPPLASVSTIYAGQAGDTIKVNAPGDVCLVECGGTVAVDDELIADSNGKAVARAASGTTNQNVGGIALEAGSSGSFIHILVTRYVVRPT